MQKAAILFCTAVSASISVGGCARPFELADPDEITLARAMDQTACSLATYRNSLSRYGVRPGQITDSVEISFNVKASAKNNSDLVLDAKAADIGPFASLGASYSNKNETAGERGNTIKIVMKNMYTAELNDPGKKVVTRDGPGLRRDTLSPVVFEKPCEPETSQIYERGPDPRAANYEQLVRGRE